MPGPGAREFQTSPFREDFPNRVQQLFFRKESMQLPCLLIQHMGLYDPGPGTFSCHQQDLSLSRIPIEKERFLQGFPSTIFQYWPGPGVRFFEPKTELAFTYYLPMPMEQDRSLSGGSAYAPGPGIFSFAFIYPGEERFPQPREVDLLLSIEEGSSQKGGQNCLRRLGKRCYFPNSNCCLEEEELTWECLTSL